MRLIGYIKSIANLPIVRNTLKLSSSSVILMCLPLLVTPILSRLYSPADYGDWGVFSSCVSIISSFIFLSYENTIVKSNDEDEVANIVGLCLFLLVVVTSLVGFVFFTGQFIGIKFFTEYPSIILLLALLLLNGINTIATNLANRVKIYGEIAIANVINGLSQALFRILLGVFPIIAYGLIVGNVLAQIIPLLFILFYLPFVFNNCFWKRITIGSIYNVARKYKKFPLFDAPARFIEFSIPNIALIILTFFCTKERVGCYSMITQFILIPLIVVGSAMANVYYREISEKSNDRDSIAISTKRVAKIAFIMSFLPILFFAFGGDKLLVLFLGKQWETAGTMALCMVLYSMPVILSEPLLPIFRTLEVQDLRFKLNCLCMLLSLGGLALSLYLTDSLYMSLIVYSCLLAFVRYIMFFKELKLAGITWRHISPWFFIINIVCISLLGFRIFLELN